MGFSLSAPELLCPQLLLLRELSVRGRNVHAMVLRHHSQRCLTGTLKLPVTGYLLSILIAYAVGGS